MKKLYYSKEEKLQARRDRRRNHLGRTVSQMKEKYIDKSNACWIWKGQVWKGGYGYVRVNGKSISAHRYMYTLYKGEIPIGICVCHSCDNPSCVNPDHLFLGTHKDNMQDMVRKGRNPDFRGNKNPNYKHGRRARYKDVSN